MTPAGLKPATPASDRLQSLALDRSATGIGSFFFFLPVKETFKMPAAARAVTQLWKLQTKQLAEGTLIIFMCANMFRLNVLPVDRKESSK